jgi:hypothetical protein
MSDKYPSPASESGERAEAPNIAVWVNAKGGYQYSVRFQYTSNEELLTCGIHDLQEFDEKFRASFPIAGKE